MTGSGTKRYQIGRDESNDIVIRHASVSRLHALLDDLGGGQYLLTDMSSTFGSGIERNGNWVQVEKAVVGAQDRLRLGDEIMAVADLLRLAIAPGEYPPQGRATTILSRQRPGRVLAAAGIVALTLAAGGVWWMSGDGKNATEEAFVAGCIASGYQTTTCRCRVKVLHVRLNERELKTYAAHMGDRLSMLVTLIAKILPATGSLRACGRR